MLFQRNTHQLPKLSQKSHVNWYLEQFYMEIHVNICIFQSNKSLKKCMRVFMIVCIHVGRYICK